MKKLTYILLVVLAFGCTQKEPINKEALYGTWWTDGPTVYSWQKVGYHEVFFNDSVFEIKSADTPGSVIKCNYTLGKAFTFYIKRGDTISAEYKFFGNDTLVINSGMFLDTLVRIRDKNPVLDAFYIEDDSAKYDLLLRLRRSKYLENKGYSGDTIYYYDNSLFYSDFNKDTVDSEDSLYTATVYRIYPEAGKLIYEEISFQREKRKKLEEYEMSNMFIDSIGEIIKREELPEI